MKLISIAILLLLFLGSLIFISTLNIISINDLTLDNDKHIYAGLNETCKSPYTEIDCAPGLECVLISTTPHENGLCLPEGTELEEDFINRNPNVP